MTGKKHTKEYQEAAAADKRLAQLAQDPSARKIMLIGGPDTGKTTTLCRMLGAALARTAAVDLDLGQSHLGPPAMLAWGMWRPEYDGLEDIVPERLFFVGATSPLANPAGAISGAATIVSDAGEHADKVLIDTSGAIVGRFARRLKLEKIRAVRPDYVVGLQRSTELEHILNAIEHERLAAVVRLPSPRQASGKNVKSRADYRQERFASYFAQAKELTLHLDEIEVLRFGAASQTPDELESLADCIVVGLVDRVGRHLGMAILRAVHREEGTLLLLANVPPGARVAALTPGHICLTPQGRELPLPK